jgi:hypothetical protein
MILRKEVLHRLVLAKSILSVGQTSSLGWPNAHLVAKQVLNGHDAADLAFSAIADQQGKLLATGKTPFMMQCLELIDTAADKYVLYFSGLNDARNSLKHTGNLPNTNQWANVGDDVFHKLSSICQATLGIALKELDESDLLSNGEVRAHLDAAKTARSSQDFKVALEEVAKALFVALEDAPSLGGIEVGRAKAEDALKLTAFGVSANDFLRLQEFLPKVSSSLWVANGQTEIEGVLWKQSGSGHPGNWREEVADFCIEAGLSVALSIQNATPVPYAHEFSDTYEYKVTAREDQVEVWEDVVDEKEHAADVFSNKARSCRVSKRYLAKGESVIVSPYAQPFVSDDFSLSRAPITRVRISHDPFSGIAGLFAGSERAEYVNLAGVNITCVPQKLALLQYPSLPDIPWEEDPLSFRLGHDD